MNISDFRFMWRGKHLELLTPENSNLLDSIDIRTKNQNRALLLIHGFTSSPAVYRNLLPLLPPYDSIVCPILPGHCDSIAAFAKVKYGDWIKAVEDEFVMLNNQYKKIDVMGLSLGGLLACELSKKHEINHMYLLAPSLALKISINLALKLAKTLKRLGFKILRNRAGNLRSKTYKELAYRQVPLSTIIEILTYIQSFKFVPPKCPLDVFLGGFDEVVNSQKVADIFEKVPQAKIHWLRESAHLLTLDGELENIVKEVTANFNHS